MRLFFALLYLVVPCACRTQQTPSPFTVNDAIAAAVAANPRLRVAVPPITGAPRGAAPRPRPSASFSTVSPAPRTPHAM